MQYVILGASAAGMSAVRAIRERDPGAGITIVSDERPYYRPMIPMLVTGEKAEADIAFLDDESAYGARFVNSMAEGVDSASRTVRLTGGGAVNYDRLLVATGARARFPGIPGLVGEGAFSFRSADAARRIRERAATAKHAVVIGGGFAGVKAAEALAKAGVSVTIIEALPEILQPRLDPAGAAIIRNALKAKGIKVETSETAAEVVRKDGALKGVKTSSGMLPAELVVVAVGTVPNVEFLAGSGVAVETGVLSGETLQTDAPGVYAAGDCAVSFDAITGGRAACALWSSAVEMGRIAGCNMAGDRLKFPGLLSVRNAAEIAGVPVVSVGMVAAGSYETVTGGDSSNGRLHRMLAFEGDTLVGAVFMGGLRGAGLYAGLIKNRIPLRPVQKDKAVADTLSYADFAAGAAG